MFISTSNDGCYDVYYRPVCDGCKTENPAEHECRLVVRLISKITAPKCSCEHCQTQKQNEQTWQ